MAISPPAADVEAAKQEMHRVRADWLRRSGVTGLDVGFRLRGGNMTGELAVRVYVKRKLKPEAVPVEELFPERLGRFPVDVLEVEHAPEVSPPGG